MLVLAYPQAVFIVVVKLNVKQPKSTKWASCFGLYPPRNASATKHMSTWQLNRDFGTVVSGRRAVSVKTYAAPLCILWIRAHRCRHLNSLAE